MWNIFWVGIGIFRKWCFVFEFMYIIWGTLLKSRNNLSSVILINVNFHRSHLKNCSKYSQTCTDEGFLYVYTSENFPWIFKMVCMNFLFQKITQENMIGIPFEPVDSTTTPLWTYVWNNGKFWHKCWLFCSLFLHGIDKYVIDVVRIKRFTKRFTLNTWRIRVLGLVVVNIAKAVHYSDQEI